MLVISRALTSLMLGLSFSTSFAIGTLFTDPPKNLVTHNHTDVESNAYLDVHNGQGNVPSVHPTKAHEDGSVGWHLVRAACYLYKKGNSCEAEIRMDPKGAQPVSLGTVTLDLETGVITPAHLSAKGYTLTVNGPGECTLSQQK